MKTLLQHITERLQLNKDRVQKIKYEYFPETKKELQDIIIKISNSVKHTKKDVINLNMIDTSEITDMSELFYHDDDCNYDISQWNVSNVENMNYMFCGAIFNNDISQWDVSQVKDMSYMFCNSSFNSNISKWNVSNVKNMSYMFYGSIFNNNISQWNVSKVEDMHKMFDSSKFNQDISQWNVNNNTDTISMFYGTPLEGKEREWWNK